jgi:hypothetical protein
MKKLTIILILLTVIVNVKAQKNITVSNAKELVEAIGPDRTITLKSGNYQLKDAYDVKSDYILFLSEYDGPELIVRNLTNLTLTGDGKVTIYAEPRYAWVMDFWSCYYITVKGIIFGHTEAGYCTGGVLHFDNSSFFTISDCEMFGSGTEGLGFKQASNFTFNNCVIRNCTYDIMTLSTSSNISFTNCTFKETGEYDLITMYSSNNISYKKCIFSDNFNSNFMPYFFNIDEFSKEISVENCKFTDNKVVTFVNDKSRLKQKGNKFKGNSFKL